MQPRRVLLIEPNYKNKYPPIGLMKLATYYRRLGDDVRFFKGNLQLLKNEPGFDIVAVTTLFTFYWDITVETINFAKQLCKPSGKILIGGIAASLVPNDIYEATGIAPIVGPLDKPGVLDEDNNLIIDSLPLDYSILDETNYRYPAADAYIAYTTRGCVNHCPFCAVPKLEPRYQHRISIKEQITETDRRFGPRQRLLLLDNNILASKDLAEIVDELKDCGFGKNNRYKNPHTGRQRQRVVDFNQGLDARLITDDKIQKLAELNIKPLRISFDDWRMQKIYERAICTAANYGFREYLNYILYNYKDTPEDFYRRIRLNAELSSKLNIRICSFPMKYHPLDDPQYYCRRDYIGRAWEQQSLRAVRVMTNTCNGVIPSKLETFERIFGVDIYEYNKLLNMPENVISRRQQLSDANLEAEIKQYQAQ